jgi:hypothetical protein
VQLLREGYSERLFLLTDEREGTVVRKQAKPEISGTLLAEIAWLEELPPSLHHYFPRVLRSGRESGSGQALFYDMPYFGQGWVLLSELILTRALDRARALALVARVMQVMFGGVFPTTYPEDEADYPERLILLLERCARRIAQLPAFSPVTFSEVVILNGTKRWNVFPLLDLLKGDARVREKLRPAAVRKVHGDLYPENVLIHIPSLRRPTPRVMLLDPVAAIGLSRGDFAMDVAKFRSWLSAELLALRLGLFSVREVRDSTPTFTLTLHTGDAQLGALGDGALLREFARLLDTAGWARAVCDADPPWRQRVSFYEALYALSMVPLVPFPQSLARFLVGLRHLHEFVCGARSALSCGHEEEGANQVYRASALSPRLTEGS